MWQRLLERFAPLMDAEPSRLDLLDGVTSAADLATTDQGASLVSVTAAPPVCVVETPTASPAVAQLTARLTSAVSSFSTFALIAVTANAVGQMSPSSRFAHSVKPTSL